jgi:monoamine oxidase
VTAADHTSADVQIDRTSLRAYIEGQNAAGEPAAPIVREAIVQAYIAEYGLAPEEQSCLNFLHFVHADRRSKFTPFGVFSDERWHVLDGNDRIVDGLTNAVAGQIELGMELVRVRRTPAGRIELTFKRGLDTLVRAHDAVVLAIPFTVLRLVDLDATCCLRRSGTRLIRWAGTNAKMMLGFPRVPGPRRQRHGTGSAGLSDHVGDEPAPRQRHAAVLTDYPRRTGRVVRWRPSSRPSASCTISIGSSRARPRRRRAGGQLRVHLEHWPSNPLTAATCYGPGQFTSIAGIEGEAVVPLYFAGEHTDSFYNWQGFMEGAALSGLKAATDILRAVKHGVPAAAADAPLAAP